MKAGWKIKKLREVVSLDKMQGYHSGLPYVGLENIESGNAQFNGSLESQAVKSMTFKFSPDHILYGRLRPYLNKVIAPDFSGHCSTEIFPIKPSSDINKHFLLYWFLWNSTVDRINETCTGARMPRANMDKVLEFHFYLPPLPEQCRIVALLDEAFAGLETLRANAEKNVQNAQELFQRYLKSVFANTSDYETSDSAFESSPTIAVSSLNPTVDSLIGTKTGGRAATTRHISGDFSLCVGAPKQEAKTGWRWCALTSLARMESGHTPSRRHSEYWGGEVPWIGIRDAKRFHGSIITDTEETINELGLANSSTRLLPAGTVCLSRTASVGYVTIMSKPMATSQDFVNWICGAELYGPFLKCLFLAQGDEFFKFSSGAVHQTIYFPEAKAFHVCIPPIEKQRLISMQAENLKQEANRLKKIYERKLAAIDELKESILHRAFSGQLTTSKTSAA